MDKFSYLSNTSAAYIEEQYQQYLTDSESVESGWQKFFEGFEFARKNYNVDAEVSENIGKEFKVVKLIEGYRTRGHLFTKTNPVRERRKYLPTLDIENFGLDQSDMDTVFAAGELVSIGSATLRQILENLDSAYRQSIGIEFMYIRDPERLDWFFEEFKKDNNVPQFSKEEKLKIFDKLNDAVLFENFLHLRFPGQKRFSLEGAESLIPAMAEIVNADLQLEIEEVVVGMAHRGRLNVLANIFKKDVSHILSEFEAKDFGDESFDGDVKYHLGHSAEYKLTNGKKIRFTMSPNPSHLEAVGAVVEGMSRAKIDQKYGGNEKKVLPILIHGDSAIIGQGVVAETIQMAGLDAYKTGGTIHIVINNQVGFTTNYLDSRTSTYCTDVGKATLSPVFHVNGDDPEALAHVMRLALKYRQKFHKDVFIDLLAYRKYGHNEGDEPKFTQPLLYKAIAKHKNPRALYLEKLTAENILSLEDAKKTEITYRDHMDKELAKAKKIKVASVQRYQDNEWKGSVHSVPKDFDKSPQTGVSKKKLIAIAKKLTEVPKGKKFFRKLERILKDRDGMIKNDKLDWGMAELLAYGSLVDEKIRVRFSGQDVERGTFSHRHAVVKEEDSAAEYCHLANVSKNQAPFEIYNSHLSEYAVMGFEYGYAMVSPMTLTIWEAQFGDFVNGAQIIIDQFLSSAEDKWHVMNGLVLLLPHGYEGMGAEHSSGRMERFLTLAAEDNMQIVNCTTPANFFHVLRRQLTRKFRKPLIVFTPKSLLRHPRCISTVDDLVKGGFSEVFDDPTAKATTVDKLVFCQGKIYYELLAKKEELKAKNVAIVRLEQLYPLPTKQIDKIITKYKKAKKILWVQEEPENMGAWSFLLRKLRHINLELISRPESASPASGSPARAEKRQTAIINKVFKK
ncbi:MAG: 2-oxoglutarate dehydrogenase E1 component [Patiriisocius sp.]|jgi:2-oxoglutarate dehydrogenase E1 component